MNKSFEHSSNFEISSTKLWRKQVDSLSSDYKLAVSQVNIEKKAIADLTFTAKDLEEARVILQDVSKEVEALVHRQISKIVSKCLKAIWGELAYEFEIVFVSKRGKTEAEIYFKRDGHQLDPLDATGGGVVDVAAFALRLASLSLIVPRQRTILVLDEPFKNVSVDLRPKVAAMLQLIAEELGFQFVISTHMKSLKLGEVVELDNANHTK
jgi:DNA repair exonuclease SbcCD ATPase subunit